VKENPLREQFSLITAAYSARLPHAGKGQAMSLRVEATDSGGGRTGPTILRANFGA
jgi:hypothetical protein